MDQTLPVPATFLPQTFVPPRLPSPDEILASFLARRSRRTREAYESDLRDFAAHIGGGDLSAVIDWLRRLTGPQANAIALSWRTRMVERGLAAATVNRRLSSLRSATALMRTVGLVAWTLEVEGERASRVWDTRGPAEQGVNALLQAARSQRDPWKAARDIALLRVIHDLALRREEAVSMDLCHALLSEDPPGLLAKGKGDSARERLSLPDPTRDALAEWLRLRGPEPGPLFLVGDRKTRRHGLVLRLSGEGVRCLLTTLSARALIPRVRPHGLRHTAITTALNVTNGDMRRVQRFSRHTDIRTLQVYDDNRTDLGGEVAKLVAARLPTP